MAAHSVGGSKHHRARFWQWKRIIRCWDIGYGDGLVQLHIAHHRHDRSARHDIEYPGPGINYGLMSAGMEKNLFANCFDTKERSDIFVRLK